MMSQLANRDAELSRREIKLTQLGGDLEATLADHDDAEAELCHMAKEMKQLHEELRAAQASGPTRTTRASTSRACVAMSALPTKVGATKRKGQTTAEAT